jgi:hypothetical protein
MQTTAGYGTNLPNNFRRAADYVDRILKGAKPSDLPIQEPVRFDFVVNLKTAHALGLVARDPSSPAPTRSSNEPSLTGLMSGPEGQPSHYINQDLTMVWPDK